MSNSYNTCREFKYELLTSEQTLEFENFRVVVLAPQRGYLFPKFCNTGQDAIRQTLGTNVTKRFPAARLLKEATYRHLEDT